MLLECQPSVTNWATLVPTPSTETHFVMLHSIDARSALISISAILQVSCDGTRWTYSSTLPSTPPSLIPTAQQSQIPHLSYIDTLPFPKLRDHILGTLAVINEEQLCKDIVSGDWPVWGTAPWDPASWEFSEPFVRKWWFLLDEDILYMTNFWRQSNLQPLAIPYSERQRTSEQSLEIPAGLISQE
jgi:hypothetical protein